MTPPPNSAPDLLPGEQIALLAARSQLERGENPPINTTAMLVLALERLVGEQAPPQEQLP